jgi:hypothetical protein
MWRGQGTETPLPALFLLGLPYRSPMVWRPPAEVEERTRAVRRTVAIWGIFGLLVAAALGVGAGVRRAASVPLTEPVMAGPLVVQLPRGWDVSRDLIPPRILARGEDGGQALVLEVSVHRADEPISTHQFMAAVSGGLVLETPRTVKLGSGTGELFVYEKRFAQPLVAGPVIATAVVVPEDDRTLIHVELERFGDWKPGDAVLVQQVARTARVRNLGNGSRVER